MKAMLLAVLLTGSSTLPTTQYEADMTQPIIITISPQNSSTTVLLGCYPLLPTTEAR